jgi:hypothetical protein
MSAFIDLTGRRFERWVVRAIHPERYRWRNRLFILWRCDCDCGTERLVLGDSLRQGRSTNCGCVRRANLIRRLTKHGMTRTRTYSAWCHMLQRCFNRNDKYYTDYGGRGISVCERWLTFTNFYADMGEAPEGMSLDRIDNNKSYGPANCRWATHAMQLANRRPYRWKTKKGRPARVVVPAAVHYEEPPF